MLREYFEKKMGTGPDTCRLGGQDHLDQIDILLKQMPVSAYPKIVRPDARKDRYVVRSINGQKILAQEIYRDEVAWVEVGWAEAGAVLEPHEHNDAQIVIFVEGTGELVMCPKDGPPVKVPLSAGANIVRTDPHTPHSIKFETDCKLFVIHHRRGETDV